MAMISNTVMDFGLDRCRTDATEVHLTENEGTDRANVVANTLGFVTVTTPAIVDGAAPGNGRRALFPDQNGGSVTTVTPTNAAWANVISGSVLLSTHKISNEQIVSSGNSFDLLTFDVQFDDPA